MPELEIGTLPDLDSPVVNGSEPGQDPEPEFGEGSNPAPYGYKADGSPRAKPGRKAGGSNSGGGGTRTGGDKAFAERIAGELVELSAPIGLLSPLTMLHVETRADRTGVALVSLCKKYPRMRLAIDQYFNSVAYKDIAFFVAGIPVALAMDYQMLDPNSKIGVPFGMRKLWDEAYGEDGTENPPERNPVPMRGLAAEL